MGTSRKPGRPMTAAPASMAAILAGAAIALTAPATAAQAAAGTANGTKIILWSCNGGANQRWSLRS